MLVIEDDPKQAVQALREFNEDELRQLEGKGITPHHLARFLESLRNNLEESQGQTECECYFV